MQGPSQRSSPLPWSDPGTETPPQVPFPGPASLPPGYAGLFYAPAALKKAPQSLARAVLGESVDAWANTLGPTHCGVIPRAFGAPPFEGGLSLLGLHEVTTWGGA